jgi:hypothetical protein
MKISNLRQASLIRCAAAACVIHRAPPACVIRRAAASYNLQFAFFNFEFSISIYA